MGALVFLAVAVGKIVTTGLTIGSGGSGGVFGPSMVIGGCGGGALGILLNQFWPALAPHPASFVIVGMAGFFAAAAKTPLPPPPACDCASCTDRSVPPAGRPAGRKCASASRPV